MERFGADVSTADRQIVLLPEQRTAWERARELLAQGLDVPDESSLDLDPELIHYLIRQGELERLATGLLMLPSQVEAIRGILTDMEGEFTVSQFRDAAGLSRKYAVPILEWADKEGLTVRRGDTRTVR